MQRSPRAANSLQSRLPSAALGTPRRMRYIFGREAEQSVGVGRAPSRSPWRRIRRSASLSAAARPSTAPNCTCRSESGIPTQPALCDGGGDCAPLRAGLPGAAGALEPGATSAGFGAAIDSADGGGGWPGSRTPPPSIRRAPRGRRVVGTTPERCDGTESGTSMTDSLVVCAATDDERQIRKVEIRRASMADDSADSSLAAEDLDARADALFHTRMCVK